MPKETLHAVHDDDLKGFLAALGIRADFAAGRLRCKFCRDVVSESNLYAVFPESGAVKVVCDKAVCIMEFLADRQAKTRNEPHG